MSDMPDNCNFEPVEAVMTMNFVMCKDHMSAKPTGGSFQVVDGLGFTQVLNTALGVIEKVIGGVLETHPQVAAFLDREYEGRTLTPRERAKVTSLLANTHLMGMVRDGEWDRPEGIDFVRIGDDD